jgi:hypothetical protein
MRRTHTAVRHMGRCDYVPMRPWHYSYERYTTSHNTPERRWPLKDGLYHTASESQVS